MTDSGVACEDAGRHSHRDGDYAAALACFERAYQSYRREGDPLAAARCARTVGWFKGWVFGDWAVAGGWNRRAQQVLAETGSGTADRSHGWQLLEAARSGNELEAQRAQYLRAIDIARACGDADLTCEAVAGLGIMLVFSGHVAEGMTQLDDALAAICSGDVGELPVVEGCLCGMFFACERTHDVVRAQEWLRAAGDVIEQRRLVAVAGYCRAHYGSILVAAGRWAEADAELVAATRLLPESSTVRGSALCRLADLRVRQGRLEEARELLAGLDHHEEAVGPLVAIHLAAGEPEPAIELLDRARAAAGLPDFVEGPLLAWTVEAELARGATERAAEAASRLAELADGQPSRYVDGIAALTAARVHVSAGNGDARASLHHAMSAFADAEMPVEVARCRLLLAELVKVDRPAAAATEAQAAFAVFDRVGATRDADAAAALLRTLGGPARTGPKGRGQLTKREAEVFALVGRGMTNTEIGARLYISPKTVEHHVGRILSKLGLRTRAEAVARAAREGSGTT